MKRLLLLLGALLAAATLQAQDGPSRTDLALWQDILAENYRVLDTHRLATAPFLYYDMEMSMGSMGMAGLVDMKAQMLVGRQNAAYMHMVIEMPQGQGLHMLVDADVITGPMGTWTRVNAAEENGRPVPDAQVGEVVRADDTQAAQMEAMPSQMIQQLSSSMEMADLGVLQSLETATMGDSTFYIVKLKVNYDAYLDEIEAERELSPEENMLRGTGTVDMTVHYEQESKLPHRTLFRLPIMGMNIDYDIRFSNYIKTNIGMMPGGMIMDMGQLGTMEARFYNVAAYDEMPAELFTPAWLEAGKRLSDALPQEDQPQED